MKTNHIYIIAAVVVFIILGFVFWNGKKTQEVSDEVVDTSTGNTNTSKPAGIPNSGSTGSPQAVPSIPSVSSLNGSTFKMISYNGVALPTDSKYTLSFVEGILSARFCNNMSGNFVLDGSLIKVANFASTMMYCATPSNLMEIESAFVSMLNFGATIYQSGNTIILSSSKGTVMVFTGF